MPLHCNHPVGEDHGIIIMFGAMIKVEEQPVLRCMIVAGSWGPCRTGHRRMGVFMGLWNTHRAGGGEGVAESHIASWE